MLRRSDLFEDWTDSTTLIFEGYPISEDRFVTMHVSNYSLEKHGLDALLSIKVWENRQLGQLVHVTIDIILSAASGEEFCIKAEDGLTWVQCVDCGGLVEISTFGRYEGKVYDKWEVHLTKDELDFLAERLKPLEEGRANVSEQ